VIGASSGAIEALMQILPSLPADLPVPIFIVVHLPSDADSALFELFAPVCRLAVKEAEDKEQIRPGVAYFAPANYHLLVESERVLSLSVDPPELFSRPSINVLFESAADAYGSGLIGIILTGASNDGAHGLSVVSVAGGLALAQDPRTAQAAAMPQAALEACPSAKSMSLREISALLNHLQEGTPLSDVN